MKKRNLFIALLVILIFSCILIFIKCFSYTMHNVNKIERLTKVMVKENTIGSRKYSQNNYLYYLHKDKNSTYDYGSYTWDMEKKNSSWTYYNGILMYALIQDEKYYNYVLDFYNDNLLDNGNVNNTRNRYNIRNNNALDSVALSRTLFYIKNEDMKPKYTNAIELTYNILEKHDKLKEINNNYRHKMNNPKWVEYPFALDGLYVGLPFLMEYSNLPSKKNISQKIQNEVYVQMEWVAKHMKDKYGLYNHGVKKDGKTLNGICWLRGAGWYAMAQIDIIEKINNQKQKEEMIKNLKSFLDTMIKYQDKKTGMWRNIVIIDKNIENNRFETSGSAMMAYTLLKAYNLGYLNDKKYLDAGLKAFNGTVKNKVRKFGPYYKIKDTYLFSGVKSIRIDYCENIYVDNEAKGIAPLILASKEAKKAEKNRKKMLF